MCFEDFTYMNNGTSVYERYYNLYWSLILYEFYYRGKEVFTFRVSEEEGEDKIYCIDIPSQEAEFPDVDSNGD